MNVVENSQYIPFLLPIAIIIFIPFIFIIVTFTLGELGSWGKLSAKYPALHVPSGTKVFIPFLKFKYLFYNNVTSAILSEEGLYLSVMFLFRIGHPAILIPWANIEPIEIKNIFFSKMLHLNIKVGMENITLSVPLTMQIESGWPFTPLQ